MGGGVGASVDAVAQRVEVDHPRQAQAARHGVGEVLRVPLPRGGGIGGGCHGYSPLLRTRSALPNWSVPETTMRSPAWRPDRISTWPRLLAPAWIGRRVALPPSTTQATLPPSCSRKGPRSTISTFLRVSSTMRADSRWFWRRPGGCWPSEKRRRALTSPLTTSGETAETSAW